MKPCYNIIGICDKNSKKGLKFANELNTNYIFPENLDSIDYDIIYVTTRLEVFPDVFRELVYKKKLGIKKVKFYKEFYKELEFSFGELNPDKTIYVLRLHPGMSGIVTKTCGFTGRLYGLPENIEVFIDLMNYANGHLEEGEIGKINAWEKWFEQPCGLNASEVYNSKHVILSGIEDYQIIYKQFYNNFELERMYSKIYKKYIILNKKMQNVINEEIKRINFDASSTCAVIFRGTDYALLKPHNHHIQPTIEDMIAKVHELKDIWGFKKIYFSTEDAAAYKKFVEEFGNDVIWSERELIENFPLNGSKTLSKYDHSSVIDVPFKRENDKYYKGLEYLRQIHIAAKCDYLISGITGGLYGALLISKGFKKKYLFDIGIYGEDDDSYVTAIGHYILLKEEKEREKQRMEAYKS